MSDRYHRVAVLIAVAAAVAWRQPTSAQVVYAQQPTPATTQPAASASAPPTIKFVRLISGDCRVRVEVPTDANLGRVQLLRNDNGTTAVPRLRRSPNAHATVIEFLVAEPPRLGEQFAVSFGTPGDAQSDTVNTIGPSHTTCSPRDDRGIFEPTVFVGVSGDAFAPNETRQYPANTDYSIKRSAIVRVDGDFRVGGQQGTWLDHLWLGAGIKYAVRSTDLDCNGIDKKSPACDVANSAVAPPGDLGGTVTAIVLRASKIEAIFRPRYEFYTFNPDSDFAGSIYLLGRFGFGQAPEEVKVENIYSGGVGFMFQAGYIRGTGVEAAWGVDRGYRTNPSGVRTRLDYRLIVGAKPSLRDQIPFVSRLGQTMRVLFEVVSDRNSTGPGPDGTQTFLGLALDFGRLLP